MKILLKRGTTSKVNDASLDSGEVAIDTTTKTLTLGTTVKKHTVQASKVATKTSQLSNDIGAYASGSLTKISQLTDNVGYWKKSDLTRVSQLTNDSSFKTGYCSYCTYCQQCNNCHNCNTVNCTTVNCTTINCNTVACNRCNEQRCSYEKCQCNCECNDSHD